MIEAIVFDLDGTIVDTESLEFASWNDVFREHGAELPLEVWSVCIGTFSDFDPYAYLEQQIGRPVERTAVMQRRRQYQSARSEKLGPLPGVVDYLEAAQRMGLKIGLASSSRRAWVMDQDHLQRLGLAKYFACVKTADDVEKVKPEPDLYLRAVQALGVSPSAAIAIEDSPNGARAAKRAGLFCVVVPNDVTRELPFDAGDLRLASLAELPLQKLIERVEVLAQTG